MNIDKEKVKREISVYSRKTGDFIAKSCKWIKDVSVLKWDIASQYTTGKIKEVKIKNECMKLGQTVYQQWKNKKEISASNHINRIKEYEKAINDHRSSIKKDIRKLRTLFGLKTSTHIKVDKKAPIATEQPLQKKAENEISAKKPAKKVVSKKTSRASSTSTRSTKTEKSATRPQSTKKITPTSKKKTPSSPSEKTGEK